MLDWPLRSAEQAIEQFSLPAAPVLQEWYCARARRKDGD